ncbi:hypothetical protein AML91_07420 [Paenibacillus jilunlii]|uniref:Uncharacterized protein n=1 Tax=Paenibacillus jilunlii TaxID=682956 RepID=A0ABR5SYE4_9BACL|nr:hypothetical protein AML91_07420 [Paenibacillus jilunlii]
MKKSSFLVVSDSEAVISFDMPKMRGEKAKQRNLSPFVLRNGGILPIKGFPVRISRGSIVS